MRVRTLFIVAMTTISCGVLLKEALGGRQSVALFPPQAAGVEDGARVSSFLGQALAEKLQDRFDVRLVAQDGRNDPEERKRKARSLGVTYVLTGNVSRIGRTATLDLTLAPTENPRKGRTVFVTAEEKREEAEDQKASGNIDLPFTYRRMAIEASAKLKLYFFGDGQIGEGDARRKIPSLSGKVTRSRNLSGELISLAIGDTDRDGKHEIAAGQSDSVVVFQLEGEDLVEKARLPETRSGLLHVDVADLNRNGIAEIVSVHYISGRAISDVWEFDGKQYQRIAKGIPYFLRTVDLGPEGIVLVGQESDPVTIYAGPVFRIALDRYGLGKLSEQAAPIPLPPDTWVYSFSPVIMEGDIRYVSLGETDRLILLDGKGEKLWESIDVVSRTEMTLEAAVGGLPRSPGKEEARRLSLPGRIFAADLDGDKTDEIILVNNIVSVGGFFENLRIFMNAEVVCFGQHGDRLELAWRTPQIESPARDAFLDVTPVSKSFRIGIASRDKAKILGKFGEWRLYWVK